jgi:transposase-like protein
MRMRRPPPAPVPRSTFSGFHFPPDVIVIAVHWYLRFGRLKARLRPMRGLKQDHSARLVIAGHASVQNLRRGHYELAVEEPVNRRLAVAFDELAVAI